MPIVPRLVEQVTPEDKSNTLGPKPLAEYFDKRVVVLLGGPGIGKTTEFEQAATQEANVAIGTVSQFLADPIENYQHRTVYLDALDEHRAELHQGKALIDAIRGRLIELGCPKVRLSCRGEEWQQGSDVQSLQDVTNGEPVYTLRLLPLSEDGVRAIAEAKITDVDAFLEGAHERQLEEPLRNPDTLKRYLKVFQKSAGWPETRTQLMEQFVELLIQESNDVHENALASSIGVEQLIQAAEDLSAIMLFSDSEALALNRPSSSERCIALQDLPSIELEVAQVAARRRVFSPSEPGQVYPEHKTTGDFLAAKALVRRIRENALPLGRALTLMTGDDGRPLSHMRDTYAWLVALLPDRAVQLIESDPFGVLVYGDAGQWTLETRRVGLRLLSEYAEKHDPWFRADEWYAPLLGGLAHEELIDDFRDVLRSEPSPHVISVVLNALLHGHPLPEIADDLLAFIRDTNHPERDWLKDDALAVFDRLCPERGSDRMQLLEEIRQGDLRDEHNRLRGMLLTKLYPAEIGANEIVEYLPPATHNGSRSSDWFVNQTLLERTSHDDLPVLADTILADPSRIRRIDDFNERRLRGCLIRRLLDSHGATASPAQIYNWLALCLDQYSSTRLEKRDVEAVRDFLASRPRTYADVFWYWIQLPTQNDDRYMMRLREFNQRIAHSPPPSNFPVILLRWASKETDTDKAEFLFDYGIDMIMQNEPRAYGISLDDLFEFVGKHQNLADSWEKWQSCVVSDWRWEDARRKQDYRKRKAERVARNVRILTPRIRLIQTGKDVQNLDYAAETWFGHTPTACSEASPLDRIKLETNEEISHAALEGFVAALRTNSPFTPKKIVDCDNRGRRFFGSYAVLAGADILAEVSIDTLLQLPDDNLKAALTYNIVQPIGGESRGWDKEVIGARPDMAKDTLLEIWNAQLAGGKTDNLKGSYIHETKDVRTPIILTAIDEILRTNPKLPPRVLKDLLENVLRHGDPNSIYEIVPEALANKGVRGDTRTIWLACAALMNPSAFSAKLQRRMRADAHSVSLARAILTAGAATLMHGSKTAPQLQLAISVLGKFYNNEPLISYSRRSGWRGNKDAAESIRGMIDTLSGLASDDARVAFDTLVADPTLHDWYRHLRHAQAVQAKNRRDARHKPFKASEVANLLRGGPPTDMADFQVLVVDILSDLAARIRGENANLWKSFWILAGRGALDRPKIENDCRDVIVPWVNPYLTSRDIIVEPEAAAADQKRVDIRLTHPRSGTLPIEVKRDDREDLWTAMSDQLLARYANDPKTQGYGIYLVLWFGKAGNGCESPPRELGIDMPESAADLRANLEAVKPNSRIQVHVIDVSKPHV